MPILRTSRHAADCPFSTIPKGLRIGCFSLQMWLSHFGQKMGNRIAFQLVCAQHDTNTCQFSNAKSGFKRSLMPREVTVSENHEGLE